MDAILTQLLWGPLTKALGTPESWKGNCSIVAYKAAELIGPEACPVRGHFLGEIAETSIFANRSHLGFCPHSWVMVVVKGDSTFTLVDPTRWVFEGVEPYIFTHVGPHEDYDEGGSKLRETLLSPPPKADRSTKGHVLKELMIIEAQRTVIDLLGDTYEGSLVYADQWFWLSNLPYEYFIPFVRDIYTALEKIGCGAFIPIDNYSRMEREYPN